MFTVNCVSGAWYGIKFSLASVAVWAVLLEAGVKALVLAERWPLWLRAPKGQVIDLKDAVLKWAGFYQAGPMQTSQPATSVFTGLLDMAHYRSFLSPCLPPSFPSFFPFCHFILGSLHREYIEGNLPGLCSSLSWSVVPQPKERSRVWFPVGTCLGCRFGPQSGWVQELPSWDT